MEQCFRTQFSAIMANKNTPTHIKIHLLQGLRASLLYHLQNERTVVQKQTNYMGILSEFNQLYKNLNTQTYESYIKSKNCYSQFLHEYDENESESKRKVCLQKMHMLNEGLRQSLKNLIEKKRYLKGLSKTIDDHLKCKKTKFIMRMEALQKAIKYRKSQIEKSKADKGKESIANINANKQNQKINSIVQNALN